MADKERADKSIEEMEKELDSPEVAAPKPGDDPWAGEEREKDERDGEPRVKIYNLSIPNKATRNEKPNPGYHKLCLDQDFAIEPRDIIRCIVLDRTFPRVAQVPFKKQKDLPQDQPWLKYLGYSFDGHVPSPDSEGKYMKMCLNGDVCWKQCSLPSRFEDGEVQVTPLADGECPHGRWGNTLPADIQTKFKVDDETPPRCNDQIVFYCWDLDIMIPFRAFFKITSIGYARDFIASCSRGMGDDIHQYPFYAFEAQIMVEDKGEYSIPKIINTNKFTQPATVKPIVAWLKQHRQIVVRNLSLQMEEFRKNKEKKDAATDFNPKDYD
jgi:hypothetical protein